MNFMLSCCVLSCFAYTCPFRAMPCLQILFELPFRVIPCFVLIRCFRVLPCLVISTLHSVPFRVSLSPKCIPPRRTYTQAVPADALRATQRYFRRSGLHTSYHQATHRLFRLTRPELHNGTSTAAAYTRATTTLHTGGSG